MPAQRKVSIRQMELLADFAESHLDIALNRYPGGPQAVRVTREAWKSIAVQLNSVAEGTTKTPDQWRRYWIEFKARTKSKAADSRRNASATGGGPNKLVPLNDIEERVLAIIGSVAVEGLPGVRLDVPSVAATETPAYSGITTSDPVIHFSTSTTIPQSSVPHPISSEPLMDVEWLDEEVLSPLGLQPELQTISPPLPAETQPPETADIPTQSEKQTEVSSRGERHARLSTISTSPTQRSRAQRQTPRNERPPRWAYDIEMRRIAAEERHTAAIEAMVALIKDIRDDVHSYVHRTE